ncbi:MAG: TonB-dependent receptor, partial [Saprospiraceae bacterium]|nr:TonB-dependent receptor [Saprospiraceae bacterium]
PLSSGHGRLQLPLTLVYTYTDATFQSSFESEFEGWGTVEKGDNLPYLAKHQMTLAGGLHSQKLSINLSGRYQSDMLITAGSFEEVSTKLEGHIIADMNITYSIGGNVALYVNVTNVLDKKYAVAARPAGFRPGLPRNVMAGIKVQF